MAGLYDFSSPYVAVSLTLESGEKIPLWTNAANAQPAIMQGVGLSALSYVTQVSVKTNLGALPEIIVTLQPPFREAMKFLESPLIEWGRTKISVEFGYSGGTDTGKLNGTPVSGLMLAPAISVASADITITLRALGSLGLAVGERNFVTGEIRRDKLMELVLQGPDPDNARDIKLDFEEAYKDTVAFNALATVLPSYSPSHKNDMDLLQTLASECHCWIRIVDKSVLVIPRGNRLKQKPKMSFSLMDFPRGEIGPAVKRFPILGFSTPTTAMYLPGALRAMVSRGITSSDRSYSEVTVTDADAKTPRVGPQQGAVAPKATSDTPGMYVPPPPNSPKKKSATSITGDGATWMSANVSDPEVRRLMTTEFDKMQAQFAIHANVETLGVPDLFPGDVVKLEGLGWRMNGTYVAFEVTHTIQTGGFSTKFLAISNVMGMENKDAVAPEGHLNKEEPDITGQTGDFAVEPKDGGGTAS